MRAPDAMTAKRLRLLGARLGRACRHRSTAVGALSCRYDVSYTRSPGGSSGFSVTVNTAIINQFNTVLVANSAVLWVARSTLSPYTVSANCPTDDNGRIIVAPQSTLNCQAQFTLPDSTPTNMQFRVSGLAWWLLASKTPACASDDAADDAADDAGRARPGSLWCLWCRPGEMVEGHICALSTGRRCRLWHTAPPPLPRSRSWTSAAPMCKSWAAVLR